jgi:hypothetical protein
MDHFVLLCASSRLPQFAPQHAIAIQGWFSQPSARRVENSDHDQTPDEYFTPLVPRPPFSGPDEDITKVQLGLNR